MTKNQPLDETDVLYDNGVPNSTIFTSNNSVFLNSKCLFTEYHDVIKAPWFNLLYRLANNKDLNKLFDMSPFQEDEGAAFEWYVNREFRNPLWCLKYSDEFLDTLTNINEERMAKDPQGFVKESLDKLLNDILESCDFAFDSNSELNFYNSFRAATNRKMIIDDFVIYNETDSKQIRKDIEENFSDNVRFLYGDFEEVISKIDNDSTFVLSDITKIHKMVNVSKINYTSIIIADRFGYNYKTYKSESEKDDEPVINIDNLYKSYLFKIDFFDNIHVFETR